MGNENIGSAIFAIAATVLALATFNKFSKEEFTATEGPSQNVVQRYSGGPTLSSSQDLQNFQDSLIVNAGTNIEDMNKLGARYYLNLESYLNPSSDNLELAQNISARPINAGVPLPGASSFYKNSLGEGYTDNLGHLNGNSYPSVNYQNDRASQLSQCAKDLPMFAASSLLPKPSVNANNNALSQSAARALAAFTALSPVEQIGAITSNNTPYSKTSDYRALVPVNFDNYVDPIFQASSALGISPSFGQVQSNNNRGGPSGFTNN